MQTLTAPLACPRGDNLASAGLLSLLLLASPVWADSTGPAAPSPATPHDTAAARSGNSLEDFLSTLPPDTWANLPDTRLQSVLEPAAFDNPAIRLNTGPKSITSAWNGAVWIEAQQRLDVVAAGGHGDYCGNEYNSFDLEHMRWNKIHGPSSMEGYDFLTGKGLDGEPGIMPDGKPASRHTYQGQVYFPPTGKIYMFGGSLCSGAGVADNNWWSVTLDGKYERLGSTGRWEALGDTALYDPVSGYIFRSKRNNIQRFDVPNRELVRLTSRGDQAWGAAAAIDVGRRTILTLGHGVAFTFNIDSQEVSDIHPGGDTQLVDTIGMGLVYVESIDRYVAWSQGNTLYFINPANWHISSTTVSGEPPADNSNGIFGRFAYSNRHQLFLVFSAIDRDISVLRLSAITGGASGR